MAAKKRKSAKRTAKRSAKKGGKKGAKKEKKPLKFLVSMYNKMPANHAKLGRLIVRRGGKISK